MEGQLRQIWYYHDSQVDVCPVSSLPQDELYSMVLFDSQNKIQNVVHEISGTKIQNAIERFCADNWNVAVVSDLIRKKMQEHIAVHTRTARGSYNGK